MLATNSIPHDLRYQLEFENLPARATTLDEKELQLLLGGTKYKLWHKCKDGDDCKSGRCKKRRVRYFVKWKGWWFKTSGFKSKRKRVCVPKRHH